MSSHPNPPPFQFPTSHSFPPFFTLQPNLSTRVAQLRKWSLLIQRYCRHHRIFRLSLTAHIDSELFKNVELRKRLSANDAREVLEWMTLAEGGKRAEWVGEGGKEKEGQKGSVWVYWKRPEEWGEGIYSWVEETGQKNTVLTLYELMNGEMTLGQDFHGMDQELFRKSLNVLVKRGKAQIFGGEDQQGVKFF